MALILCPECGKEISDKASACPNCGCPIQPAEIPNPVVQRTAEEKPKKKSKAAPITVIVVIAVLGMLCTVYFGFLSTGAKLRSTYNKATTLYNTGNYVEALPMYEGLGEYSNSADAAIWCRYELAKEAISNGYYETAKGYLEGVDFLESAMLSKQCDYQLGIQAMEAHDWETAAAIFERLDYENSGKMLTDCSFMLDIEQSITRRMEINAKESSDYKTLVNTELAYLEQYRKATFYNVEIGRLAKKYLEGLDKQLAALNYEYYYEFQLKWYEGMVKRYDVLISLHKNYGLMSNNQDFVGTYIKQYEDVKRTYNGIVALEKMFDDYYSDESYSYIRQSGRYVILTHTNITEYTFDGIWVFTYFDRNDTKIKELTVRVDDIKPGETFEVKVYNSDAWNTIDWYNYYDDIK